MLLELLESLEGHVRRVAVPRLVALRLVPGPLVRRQGRRLQLLTQTVRAALVADAALEVRFGLGPEGVSWAAAEPRLLGEPGVRGALGQLGEGGEGLGSEGLGAAEDGGDDPLEGVAGDDGRVEVGDEVHGVDVAVELVRAPPAARRCGPCPRRAG